jgi:hypothetical protein
MDGLSITHPTHPLLQKCAQLRGSERL